jgi:cytosine/adenosine deaminase-related metal-dependent hydrolase
MTPGLVLRGGLVLRDGTFAVADIHVVDDRIASVGPSLSVPDGAVVIPIGGDLVVPGLVNAHYHSPDNLSTGAIPHAPLELWSLASVPRRTAVPDALRTAALFGAAQLLSGGVTGVVDMIRVPGPLDGEAYDAIASAYVDAGMRADIAPVLADLPVEKTLPLGPWEPVTGDRAAIDAAIGAVERFARRWDGRAGRIGVQVAPSGPQRCTDDMFAAAVGLARRLGTRLHTHALETSAQARQARLRWGVSLIAHLQRTDALSPDTVLAHLVWPDPEDLDLVARSGAIVVHNPASNLALGSGRAPLPELLARGVPVALGTDAATCNDGLSLFEAMKLATTLHRPDEPDHRRWPTAGAALTAATAGGAAALGLTARAGRIAPGLVADLVVLDGAAPAFVPPNDLVRQLVMRAGPDVVRHVFVGGQQLVRDGTVLTIDVRAVADEMRRHSASGVAVARPDGALESAISRMLGDAHRTP